MKYILILLFSLICLDTFSQNQNIDANQVLVRQYFRIPVIDTIMAAKFDKEWRIRPQNGLTYQYNASTIVGAKWAPLVGNSSGISGITNVGAGAQLFKQTVSSNSQFRTLTSGFGVIFQQLADEISLKIDTLNGIPTMYMLQKSKDSLGQLITFKTNISDTAAMLANYFRKPTGSVNQYVRGDGSVATFPTIPPLTSITSPSPQLSITPNGVNGFIIVYNPDIAPGTVTSVSSGSIGSFATTSVATPGTTPAISYTISNAPSYSVWQNATGLSGIPTYSAFIASTMIRNQGTTTNILIGNAVGPASWGKVNLSTMVVGNLQISNFNSAIGASSSTFWRGDGIWAAPPSSGGGGSSNGGNITPTSNLNP